ncbi:MAG: PspC domain-containing protein [Bacillota bacterium]
MKKLYRSKHQRMLGGVSGGLAEYFETDIVLVRLAWVVFGVLTGGIGALLAYIVAWILIPEEPDVPKSCRVHTDASEPLREEPGKQASEPGEAQGDGAPPQDARDVPRGSDGGSAQRLFGFILVGLGALLFLDRLLPVHYRMLLSQSLSRLWPLLIIALGVAMLVKGARRE